MHTLKYAVKIVLLIIFLNISAVSVASADISDITDIATNAVSTVVSEDNEQVKNNIIIMLENDVHKQELQNYIIDTRPIIEKYQYRLEIAVYVAYFSEKYIPFIGGVISSTVIEGIYYFYKSDLEDAAKTSIAEKFSTLRNNSIDLSKDLLIRTLSYGIENEDEPSKQSDMDISTVINVGIKYQQKQVLMDYMRDIMEKSNMDCNTIDTGCIDNFGI